MFSRRFDVFISYSRADGERVRPLRDELSRMGYRVFFDVQTVEPGDRWKQKLERSIRASRNLVLCWSEHTRRSEYVTYEYSRADALHRPVYPWLLDQTPLPAMLELQGISSADPVEVAASLRPKFGWNLRRRRLAGLLLAILLVAVAAVVVWHLLKAPPPPPPWTFQGEITDRITRLPVAGVEVDVTTQPGAPYYKAMTGPDGRYALNLPAPAPDSVIVQFRKAGYEGDQTRVRTDKPFNSDLVKLP